jgi:hypothetical protein
MIPACSHRTPRGRPSATLSSSSDAQVALAPIREAWATQSRKGRAELRGPLEAFVARFPNDGATVLARAYLVFIYMDAGESARADGYLRALELTTPRGSTRDLLTVGRAKQLRLLGHADMAFELLRPLVGKVVDPASRALLQEEVSLAAIESHRDYEAIAYMDSWLRNASEEERASVRAEVIEALAKLPTSVLEGSLRAMRARGAASGYGREIERLVSERLAQVALANGDPELARWLLNPESGTALLGDSEGALGELATSRRGLSSVEGRMIGLILPTGSNELRGAAADVMRGVAYALDLPRVDRSAGEGTRLATRSDGGDAERVGAAMSELAGEGAAVVIAALDPRSADEAVKWGEAHALPVLVLSPPRAESPRDFAFVLGEPRATELEALSHALVDHGVSKVAPVLIDPAADPAPTTGSGFVPPTSCAIDASHAGEARFPVASWRADGVKGWLVDGPAECARDLIAELGEAGDSGIVALTLDAAETPARSPKLRLLSTMAGSVPVTASKPDDVGDPDLRQFMRNQAARPSWWTALGRDAGALARKAVTTLPLTTTTDAAEVKRRRSAAKEVLATAQLRLWTTDADGMAGGRALRRHLQVIELLEKPRTKK